MVSADAIITRVTHHYLTATLGMWKASNFTIAPGEVGDDIVHRYIWVLKHVAAGE